MPPHAPIEIRIDSDPANLCVVRSAVESAAQRWGLPMCDCDKLVLAVDEALTNIIRHGYQGRPGQPIWVTLSPLRQDHRRGIEIIIDDETENVDPRTIKPRRQSTVTNVDDLKPGGLGVSIIEQSVDHYDFQNRPGTNGLRLTLHKYARENGSPQSRVQSPEL